MTKSDEGDWRKLRQLMNYLEKSVDNVRIIEVNIVEEFFTWVDAAYVIHDDIKSHTGGTMSFGHRDVHCQSSKQKLNTNSSTEAELVQNSEYLPCDVWMEMFMGAQGYEVNKILFQDNQSAIKI